jgi:hypothetical protein
MKKILLLILALPFVSAAQNKPRFENDTLYTSCGYKIYIGQTLQFGKAMGWDGFRYITVKNGVRARSLENNSIVVKDISGFDVSSLGNYYIDIKGSIIYKDGSKGVAIIHIAFEHAISKLLPGIIGELIVPDEFRISKETAGLLNKPGFHNDTLSTSCGYKIYKGQLLQFGKMTGNRDRFRYVNIKTDITHRSLENRQVRVKELKDFGISVLGNAYITIIGTLIVNNNDRGDIEIHLAFDHAIENIPGVPSELVVPDEFRNRLKVNPQATVLLPKKNLKRLKRNCWSNNSFSSSAMIYIILLP